jgi:hypothetical protein
MNLNQQDSLDEDEEDESEEIDDYTLKLLFCKVFPKLSDLFIFTIAFFSQGQDYGANEQFRMALRQELFRRGLLVAPQSGLNHVIVDKFDKDGTDVVKFWFACDSEGTTVEDRYVRLLTGRDRWAERNAPNRKRHTGRKPHRTKQSHSTGI